MTAHPVSSRSSLERTLTVRLALTAVLAMLLQLAIVAASNYFDNDGLLVAFVRLEAKELARRVVFSGDGPEFDAKSQPPHYRGSNADGYGYRIFGRDGQVVAEHNGNMLLALSPWRSHPSGNEDLWLRNLDQRKRLFVAGGLRERSGANEIWVEVMTTGDPAHRFLSILSYEILDDVWMPMIPLIMLSLGVAMWSIRRSLKPLKGAACKADALSANQFEVQLDAGALPREVASFILAINRLLRRTRELMSAQQLFMARAAHELRTPLSVLMLEFSRIDHPRVRRLEADVRAMSEMVNQVLTLARLEGVEGITFESFDLSELAQEVVGRLDAWAEQHGQALRLSAGHQVQVQGDRIGLRAALRNLIENAIKHTPAGSQILIGVESGASLIVEDSGPGINERDVEEVLQPFKKGHVSKEGSGLGLTIVQQVAVLHSGTLTVGRSSLGGARLELKLPKQKGGSPFDAVGSRLLSPVRSARSVSAQSAAPRPS
jgi:two-component system, OmpR family, sensor histidine kinase QseC